MREFKPFRLDPVNHMLWRRADDGSDVPVAITAKTFDVLRYLVEHPGRLVTHEELLESLWTGVAVQPEVLKGHVLAIRHALGDDPQQPRFVETHRGRGYRFIAEVSGDPAERFSLREESVRLIGREAPLMELREALTGARMGRAQMVFVQGDAGIGKTALVERFCADASAPGLLLALGRCIEGFGGAEPFYPVLEALARMLKGSQAHRVQEWLVDVAPSWAEQLAGLLARERRAVLQKAGRVMARSRMLGEFCDFVEAVASEHLLVVLLEDLHWADYSTLDLLSAMARRRLSSKVVVIGTSRMDEAVANGSPLKLLVDDLLIHKLCRKVVLPGLSLHDTEQYLQEVSAERQAFAELLWQRSGGNPLFLEATLDHLHAVDLVSRHEGKWRSNVPVADIRVEVPPTIAELVEAKIVQMDEETQRVLEAASAVGEVFNAMVPAAAAGLSAHRFEEVCEMLSRVGHFILRQDLATLATGEAVRSYRFKHALYREALLNRQGPLRLAQTHALIGKELERAYPVEAQTHAAFELVEQFTHAREWSKGIAYLRVALQTAKCRFAHHDALAILDKADAMACHLPDLDRALMQVALLEDRASIYAASHDRRALQAFSDLASQAEQLHLVDVQARAELGLGFALSWRDVPQCMLHLERAAALSQLQGEPQLKARVQLSSAAWRIWIAGWDGELARVCEESLLPLRNGADRQIAAWGMIEYSMVCLVSSRYREALETIETHVEVLTRHAADRPEFNVFRAIWMAHLGRPWAYTMLGEWGRALEEFDASEALFVGNANRYSACTLETLRAFLYLMGGDYQGVKAICQKLGLYQKAGELSPHPLYSLTLPNEIRHCTLLAGMAEAGLGNTQVALHFLRQVEADVIEGPVVMDWYWRFMVEWGLADLMLRMGDVPAARRYAEQMLKRSRLAEEKTWRAMALELRSRIAFEESDLPLALQLIEEAVALTERIGIPLAEWRVRRTAELLWREHGSNATADVQGQLFRKAIDRLLHGLPPGHRLREAFTRLTL